jgi:hypothetical protein
MPTVNCLVELTELPFTAITLPGACLWTHSCRDHSPLACPDRHPRAAPQRSISSAWSVSVSTCATST